MKAVLFGMTGLGNEVFKAILFAGCEIAAVVTPKFDCKFPYYIEEHLDVLARRHGIKVFYDFADLDESCYSNADIVFIASFPKKIPCHIYANARFAFNIHPSLLPNYKGANPYFWVIRNDEELTGISIHNLTDIVDEGSVVLQEKYFIKQAETQGTLRYSLAKLSYCAVLRLLNLIETNSFLPIKFEPNLSKSLFYARKVKYSDRIVSRHINKNDFERILRALYPHPGCIVNKIKSL